MVAIGIKQLPLTLLLELFVLIGRVQDLTLDFDTRECIRAAHVIIMSCKNISCLPLANHVFIGLHL